MRAVPLYDEKLLLSQAAEGNEKAFSQLFYSFHQELGGYMFYLTKSLPLAEEIVQEVFIKIWEKKEQLISINNFRAYLFTISRNHAFNALRQQARDAVKLQKWILDIEHETETIYDSDLEKYYMLIETAISQLPPQQQKAWLLSRKEGLKHEEIASLLSLSRETVKRHISLALNSIKRYAQKHAYEFIVLFLIGY